MKWLNEKTIVLKRKLSELDKLLIQFVSILKKYTDYVIVSGYVSILFGRPRSTEDIDVLTERMERKQFLKLFKALGKRGFWCINCSKEDAYELISSGISLRFSKKGQIIPNVEIKFIKKPIERECIEKALTVVVGRKQIKISPIELQIAYKRHVPGSRKDVEDAKYLEELFKEKINKKLLKRYEKMVKG